MIPTQCRRLAEVDFPIAAVSRHAVKEKSIRFGHPSTLHLWWARRPLAACRAMLMALLLPDPCDPACPEAFKVRARVLLAQTWRGVPTDDTSLRRSRSGEGRAPVRSSSPPDGVGLRGSRRAFGIHRHADAPTVRGRGRGRRSRAVPDEALETRREATTLDRVHAAMLLQSSGRSNALRSMLAAEIDRSPDFLRLANALAVLYPKDSEEKRLVEAMLLAAPK